MLPEFRTWAENLVRGFAHPDKKFREAVEEWKKDGKEYDWDLDPQEIQAAETLVDRLYFDDSRSYLAGKVFYERFLVPRVRQMLKSPDFETNPPQLALDYHATVLLTVKNRPDLLIEHWRQALEGYTHGKLVEIVPRKAHVSVLTIRTDRLDRVLTCAHSLALKVASFQLL